MFPNTPYIERWKSTWSFKNVHVLPPQLTNFNSEAHEKEPKFEDFDQDDEDSKKCDEELKANNIVVFNPRTGSTSLIEDEMKVSGSVIQDYDRGILKLTPGNVDSNVLFDSFHPLISHLIEKDHFFDWQNTISNTVGSIVHLKTRQLSKFTHASLMKELKIEKPSQIPEVIREIPAASIVPKIVRKSTEDAKDNKLKATVVQSAIVEAKQPVAPAKPSILPSKLPTDIIKQFIATTKPIPLVEKPLKTALPEKELKVTFAVIPTKLMKYSRSRPFE
uniref:Ribonuclease H-like domain-containing protein n=1 Tax=Rhabditophanes sp. KR3021 TaxID=114890 RepID=A0AC35TIQ3_9BILA